MHIVAIGWLWVAFMMAITQKSIVSGVATFIFYGLLPCALVIYIASKSFLKRQKPQPPHDSSEPGDDIARAQAALENQNSIEAETICRQLIAANPRDARAWHLLGLCQLQAGNLNESEVSLRRAIAAAPDSPPQSPPDSHLYHFNLGNVLLGKHQLPEAIASFETALQRSPEHVPSLFNLASAALDLKRFDAAIDAFTRLRLLTPDDAGITTSLGIAHFRRAEVTLKIEHFDQAIAGFRSALAQPEIAVAARHNARLLLGQALSICHRHAEALALAQSILQTEPEHLDALIESANALTGLGRMPEALQLYLQATRLHPAHLPAASAAIVTGDYLAELSAEENTRMRFELGQQFRTPGMQQAWPNQRNDRNERNHRNDRRSGRPLRVGYVSPDLRQHVATVLLEAVWRHHDQQQFEWFVYDATVHRDAKSLALRALMPNWRDILPLDTDATVQLIQDDRIDILVDLAGHTSGNRLSVFARKPAPVSVTWLGYPGSTGVTAIDYLISDAYTSPVAASGHASEQIIRLPATRFCYQAPEHCPEPSLPTPETPFTFGSFNNNIKLNPSVFALWRQIFDAVPASRMIIKSAALDVAETRSHLLDQWQAAGIDPARLEIRGFSPYAETLKQYGEVHVALDPFPFCGGLTSLDALWMGVPVVTLESTLMAGRQSLAFLNLVGHPELVAANANEYVRIATSLANAPDQIAGYRAGLRSAMAGSPLLDHVSLTRHLEQSYRTMWDQYCGT